MKKATKVLALMLCAVLLVTATVAGTLAYLTDSADVTNTFTVGNVSITLQEYDMDPATGKVKDHDDQTEGVQKSLVDSGIQNIKVVPGRTVDKQPVITVAEGSEDCYLFVKIENGDAINMLSSGSFSPSTNWSNITGQTNWYQYANAVTAGTTVQVFEGFTFNNLDDDAVAVLTGGSIKITAYAIQKEGSDTVADAWSKLNGQMNLIPANP